MAGLFSLFHVFVASPEGPRRGASSRPGHPMAERSKVDPSLPYTERSPDKFRPRRHQSPTTNYTSQQWEATGRYSTSPPLFSLSISAGDQAYFNTVLAYDGSFPLILKLWVRSIRQSPTCMPVEQRIRDTFRFVECLQVAVANGDLDSMHTQLLHEVDGDVSARCDICHEPDSGGSQDEDLVVQIEIRRRSAYWFLHCKSCRCF